VKPQAAAQSLNSRACLRHHFGGARRTTRTPRSDAPIDAPGQPGDVWPAPFWRNPTLVLFRSLRGRDLRASSPGLRVGQRETGISGGLFVSALEHAPSQDAITGVNVCLCPLVPCLAGLR